MKIKILTLAFIALSFQGIAQKIEWSPSFKVKGFPQQQYVGEKNNNAVFLCYGYDDGKARLLEFSADRSSGKETELTEYPGHEAAFLENGQLYVISYSKESKKRQGTSKFTLFTFGMDGHKLTEKVLFESTDEEVSLLRENSYMSYGKDYDERHESRALVSKNKKYLGIHFELNGFYKELKNKFIIFETTDFKIVKTIDLADQVTPKCMLLNNGDLITVQGDSKSIHGKDPYLDIKLPVVITKFELSSATPKHLDVKLSAGENQFRYALYYNPSEDEQVFYLTMSFGKSEPANRSLNISQNAALGIQLFKVNLEKMELTDSKLIPFTEEIVVKTGKKNKGISNLRIKDVKEDAGSYYIAGQEIINFKDDRFAEIQHNGDLIILRESKSSGGAQACISIKNQNTVTGFNSMLYNNNYYVVYHTAELAKMLFHVVKFDQSLKTLKAIEDESFTRHQMYLDVSELHQLEKNKYCVYSQFYKNAGTAMFTLDE